MFCKYFSGSLLAAAGVWRLCTRSRSIPVGGGVPDAPRSSRFREMRRAASPLAAAGACGYTHAFGSPL